MQESPRFSRGENVNACAIATVVKAMTWIDMLHYAGCIFGCGFALMAVGAIGLALIGKAERKRLTKKN